MYFNKMSPNSKIAVDMEACKRVRERHVILVIEDAVTSGVLHPILHSFLQIIGMI